MHHVHHCCHVYPKACPALLPSCAWNPGKVLDSSLTAIPGTPLSQGLPSSSSSQPQAGLAILAWSTAATSSSPGSQDYLSPAARELSETQS